MAEQQSATGLIRWAGLVLGPLAGVAAYVLLGAFAGELRLDEAGGYVGGLDHAGRATAAVGLWMAVWWLTEAIPIPATALLPIAVFPLVGAAESVAQATQAYAGPLIYLFLGGFVLGLAMQKWGLHKRIALVTISLVGTKPVMLIAGFMVATAVMSMFVSNTATVVMLLPIGMSVVGLVRSRLEDDRQAHADGFAVCLMLGIAYAASIGGVGTLIGTPPNLVLAEFLRERYEVDVGFAQWMVVGVPLVVVFLPLTWLYLTRVAYPVRLREIPGGRELIRGELQSLGRMSRGEWTVLVVFCCTALMWLLRERLNDIGTGPDGETTAPLLASLTDTGIAIAGALALFAIPVSAKRREFAMDWRTAERLPWGVLILFGGGLTLAGAVERNYVDGFIGTAFTGLEGAPIVLLIAVVATVVIFLTEMTSNTAVTTTLLPVLAGAAVVLGVDPLQLLVPTAMAASCAFMLPVATPPNAIVFSSGEVTIAQMAKAGIWLNLAGVVLITLLTYFLLEHLIALAVG